MATGKVTAAQVIKCITIDFDGKQISAGNSETFDITNNMMQSDFHKIVAIIPVTVGPTSWGSTVPAVIANESIQNRWVQVRAYVTGTYSPRIHVLYI